MKYRLLKYNRQSTSGWESITYITFLLLAGHQSVISAETTALKDNPVITNSNFSNFDGINLYIDIPKFNFHGHYRFLKVFDNDNHIIFLGQISATQAFELPVHILKTTSKITIELFTENPKDQTITITKETLQETAL